MLDVFRTNRHLARVNALGASLALAAATSAVLGFADALSGRARFSGLVSGLTTLPVAYWYVRRMQRDGAMPVERMMGAGALNAGLALTLARLHHFDITILLTFVFGALAGTIVWGPALVLTRLCLGFPLAHAHRQAKVGLAAAESAQRLVALAVVGIALAAFSLTPSVWGLPRRHVDFRSARLCMHLAASLALALGVGVLCWTTWAERQRRWLVRRAAAGALDGYRVDGGDGRRVLLRVSTFGEGYREGVVDEPICELDPEGRVTRVPA